MINLHHLFLSKLGSGQSERRIEKQKKKKMKTERVETAKKI